MADKREVAKRLLVLTVLVGLPLTWWATHLDVRRGQPAKPPPASTSTAPTASVVPKVGRPKVAQKIAPERPLGAAHAPNTGPLPREKPQKVTAEKPRVAIAPKPVAPVVAPSPPALETAPAPSPPPIPALVADTAPAPTALPAISANPEKGPASYEYARQLPRQPEEPPSSATGLPQPTPLEPEPAASPEPPPEVVNAGFTRAASLGSSMLFSQGRETAFGPMFTFSLRKDRMLISESIEFSDGRTVALGGFGTTMSVAPRTQLYWLALGGFDVLSKLAQVSPALGLRAGLHWLVWRLRLGLSGTGFADVAAAKNVLGQEVGRYSLSLGLTAGLAF